MSKTISRGPLIPQTYNDDLLTQVYVVPFTPTYVSPTASIRVKGMHYASDSMTLVWGDTARGASIP